MAIVIQSGAGAGESATVGITSKAGYVELYDASGDPIPLKDKSVTAGATQRYLPIAGLDGGTNPSAAGGATGYVNRAIRVGDYSSVRTTSEELIFHDAFEGSTINTWWTQSLTTFTVAQATGVLTLNSGSGTAANSTAILTSIKQTQRYARQPIFCRFRASITANVGLNHTTVELGLGAPSGVVAVVSSGCFFRFKSNGALWAVVSYNGSNTETLLLAQGAISTTSYYYYDVVVDDDNVRFIVCDSNEVPIVDVQVVIQTGLPTTWAVSHLPSFARVYVDATGGGTAVRLLLSAHAVYVLDLIMNKPWEQQMAGVGRGPTISPTAYTQLPTLVNATIPATTTPSNAAAGSTALGGEYRATATAQSEDILSLFTFTVPTPYSFFLRGLYIPLPVVQGAAIGTATLLQWFVAHNASSANLLTATGVIRVPLPGWMTAAATAAAGTFFTGQAISWQPRVPIPCAPGTFLHIGYKEVTGAATASLVYRGEVVVDGYFQ